jgi:hypothetical protein
METSHKIKIGMISQFGFDGVFMGKHPTQPQNLSRLCEALFKRKKEKTPKVKTSQNLR